MGGSAGDLLGFPLLVVGRRGAAGDLLGFLLFWRHLYINILMLFFCVLNIFYFYFVSVQIRIQGIRECKPVFVVKLFC